MNVSRPSEIRMGPPRTDEVHRTLVARVPGFGNPRGETDNFSVIPLTYPQTSRQPFDPFFGYVFPNGRDASTEGSVSVLLVGSRYLRTALYQCYNFHVELACTIAVIDVEGSRRFPRSFAFHRAFLGDETGDDAHFRMDHCFSRSVLLSEPTELLPDDTLTLCLEVVLKEHSLFGVWLDRDLITEGRPGGPVYKLYLGSPIAGRMAEESEYFERMSRTSMRERNSGFFRILNEEYRNFMTIGRLLMRGDRIYVRSFDEVLDVYVTAEKYLFDNVVETCREWLKLCIRRDSVQEISEFADRYQQDVRLKEIVEAFLRGEGDFQGHDSTTDTGGEWICREIFGETSSSKSRFLFERRRPSEYDDEQESFDFYS